VKRTVRRTDIDETNPGNIKLAHIVPFGASDDDLLFLKQIGLRWVQLSYGTRDPSADNLREVQKRFARYGLQIYSANHTAYRSENIQLGQPGRDEDIETYRTFIRSLGELGIPVSGYDFHPANTYTTAHVERRGYIAREFDLDVFRNEVEENAFEREYSAEEMWDNYAYFMEAVLPVAEKANVTLALHPNDPPLARMNGVARIFSHYDGFKRAEEIAGGSRHWGLRFCVGTWAEGGDRMGKDVFEMLRDFGGRGKIFGIHFRNVNSPLPRFVETFPDDGYLDMYQVMETLREINYTGVIVPDHIPQLAGDTGFRRAGIAYCIACMRSWLGRAMAD
jgi:mannonate dehydratase